MAGRLHWSPLGARTVHLAETGSTNADALRLAGEGVQSGTWVIADRQTAGRGRSGRSWQSLEGNFTASLVLRDVFPLEMAAQLALVSGVALHAAVLAAAGPDLREKLALKWPNDLLLERRKLGGILVESSVARRDEGALAVIGIGLNLARHPPLEGASATDLSEYGASIAPLNFLSCLDGTMQEWIAEWGLGRGFASVRDAWLHRALPAGSRFAVQSGRGVVTGAFVGLNDEGALLINDEAGRLHTVTFGDVALSD